MTGKEFLNSKWCKEAEKTEVQASIKGRFATWKARVRNANIIEKANQIFNFFIIPNISRAEKVLCAGALLYIMAPIDLIPDVVPVVGWLDDIGIANFVLGAIALQSNKSILTGTKTMEELMEEEIDGTEKTPFSKLDWEANSVSFEGLNFSEASLQKKAEDLEEIAGVLNMPTIGNIVSNAKDRLSENNLLSRVAFIGRYSTGKSTLINSLLGKNYLPASPKPTTKAVTYIMYDTEDSLYSESYDGEITIHQDIQELADIYNSDIGRAKAVNLALKNFPFKYLTVIDTPGLEETDEEAMQLTYDILPLCDCLVLVMDDRNLEKKSTYEFLQSLQNNDSERKIFIVINFRNIRGGVGISEILKDEATKRCQSILASHDIRNCEIFPLSAVNIDEYFDNFKKRLFDFLYQQAKQESLRHTNEELSSSVDLLYGACSTALSIAGEEKAQERAKIFQDIATTQKDLDEQKQKLLKQIKAYHLDIAKEIDQFFAKLNASAQKNAMLADYATLKSNQIGVKIQEEITKFVDAQMEVIDKKIQGDWTDIRGKISEAVRGFDNISVKTPLYDMAKLAPLAMPATIGLTYLSGGILALAKIGIVAYLGGSYITETTEKVLKAKGLDKARETACDFIVTELKKCKSEICNRFSEMFIKMEDELCDKFDTMSNGYAEPLMLAQNSKEEDIYAAREKLLQYK